MLSEQERRQVVADVARDLQVVLSPEDPVFVAVAVNERVLARAAEAVTGRLVQQLDAALCAREQRLGACISESVTDEIARLTQGAATLRDRVATTGKGWALGLLILGAAEAVAMWAIGIVSRGG